MRLPTHRSHCLDSEDDRQRQDIQRSVFRYPMQPHARFCILEGEYLI